MSWDEATHLEETSQPSYKEHNVNGRYTNNKDNTTILCLKRTSLI